MFCFFRRMALNEDGLMQHHVLGLKSPAEQSASENKRCCR